MPRKYIRKEGAVPRGEWSETALVEAMKAMDEGKLSGNEIARRYGIPMRTLRRRFIKRNALKVTLGKHPVLDFENEKLLVAEIQNLKKAGCAPTKDMIRKMAFEFAEKLGVNVPFNKKTRMAGRDWLLSFLERHPEVNQENLSLPEAQDIEEKQIKKSDNENVKDRAGTSKKLKSQSNESFSEFSYDSDNDPLVIKAELMDDDSSDAADELFDKTGPLEESETLVEIQRSNSNEDVKHSESPLDEIGTEFITERREKLVEVKCDGLDLLFLGHAAEVKKLSRRKQIFVKQEISRIIAEAELSEVE